MTELFKQKLPHAIHLLLQMCRKGSLHLGVGIPKGNWKKQVSSYKSLTLLMGNKEQEIIFGRSLQKRCEQRPELTYR